MQWQWNGQSSVPVCGNSKPHRRAVNEGLAKSSTGLNVGRRSNTLLNNTSFRNMWRLSLL
jgi:hypothetical protein